MKIIKHIIIVIVFLILTGCANFNNVSQNVIANESVMCEGMHIGATNKTGIITITAGTGFERFYTWDGDTRSQVLKPRKKRWAGRLGIGYSKANMWQNHHTITNANLEEAQMHFSTIEEAMRFIRHRTRLDGNTVYNDNGLVVTWKKEIHPFKDNGNVLIVYVWQVLVNGKKPLKLPGSQNDKLSVSNACVPRKN
jgi:hypothetical protein